MTRTKSTFAIAVAFWTIASPVFAHPHIFITAEAEIVFEDGRVTAIRQIWRFDEAWSAFAVQGLDANNDGGTSADELEPLADLMVETQAAYGYFTRLSVGDNVLDFSEPSEYRLEMDGLILTLYFTLLLLEPQDAAVPLVLQVHDPDYYVGYEFSEVQSVRLFSAPDGCRAAYRPPGELDAQTAAIIAAVPADQRELPGDLAAVTQVLANTITVACA